MESAPSPRATPLRYLGAVIEGEGVLGLGEEEPALGRDQGLLVTSKGSSVGAVQSMM